jgi:Xaa-Pro dipeptidase
MPRDPERLDRLQTAIQESRLDALVCALPENVLLLTGYFPVVGTSIAVMTRDRHVTLLAPEDEMSLADCDGADEVIGIRPGSLDELTGAVDAVREPIARVLRDRGLNGVPVGYERGPAYQPASYVAMHLYGSAMEELLETTRMRPADDLLARMKGVLTTIELDRLRRACRIAQCAFNDGAGAVCPGRKETAVAGTFRAPLSVMGVGFEGVSRADGEVFCMSGPNSAKAFGAYARSRARELEIEDFALVHCNSHADGYWTDITRTYCVRMASDRQREMYRLIFEARRAAFEAVRPGAHAADVDRAARDVFRAAGCAEAFKHGTGHGVGYAAINHLARPRIHPASDDVLECGMAFNIEPALYYEGFGGARHCDMVAVTKNGVELLTPFQSTIDELLR